MVPKDDPLETQKVEKPKAKKGGKQKKKPAAEAKPETVDPELPPPPEPVSGRDDLPEGISEPPPLPPPPDVEGLPKSKSGKYCVGEEKAISWYGQITFLGKGSIVDARSYGADGMKRLVEQGVKLEPVEDE